MKYLKMLFVFLNLVACGSGTETRGAKEKKTQAQLVPCRPMLLVEKQL